MPRRKEFVRAAARRLAEDKGHFMEWFEYEDKTQQRATSTCRRCGMTVTVTLANTYPIAGQAVVLGCAQSPLAQIPIPDKGHESTT